MSAERAARAGSGSMVPGAVHPRCRREAAASVAINRFVGGAVIVAGSGKCAGRRVHLHLGTTRRASAVVSFSPASRTGEHSRGADRRFGRVMDLSRRR